jgi:hypothetical protein
VCPIRSLNSVLPVVVLGQEFCTNCAMGASWPSYPVDDSHKFEDTVLTIDWCVLIVYLFVDNMQC